MTVYTVAKLTDRHGRVLGISTAWENAPIQVPCIQLPGTGTYIVEVTQRYVKDVPLPDPPRFES